MTNKPNAMSNLTTMHATVAELPTWKVQFDEGDALERVREFLDKNKEIPGVIVTREGKLRSVVSREMLFRNLSRRFALELFLANPIRSFLEQFKTPLMELSGDCPIHRAAELALAREGDQVYEPLVVVHGPGNFGLLDSRKILAAQSQLLDLALTIERDKVLAESANRAKSEFLATMSHELRTPLNGVLGMNELLLKTELTDKQRAYVDVCLSSGRALLKIINDLLDLSKIESGKLELDIHECDLEALVYDVIGMFSHGAKQRGLSFTCQFDSDVCIIARCDDSRVRQVLVNLIGNALKFTKSGGIVLKVARMPRDRSRLVARFTVSDSGVGIPEARLSRLFTPFTQIDSSTARHFGGTGLGLSICKQLVELMGGRIGAESRLGAGSSFWFEIPFEVTNQLADSSRTIRRQRLDGTRVLAIDGIGNDRSQVDDCLRGWGCHVEHVPSVPEAFAAIAHAGANHEPFGVVLTDCSLATGDEYIHLQKLSSSSDLPMIGLGAGAGDDQAAHLHRIGLRHLLSDPIRPSGLFDALASVLAVSHPGPTGSHKPPLRTEEPRTTISGHILVAEDNEINQMYVVELLKDCGCTCDVASNGDEALVALQQKHYDLVLMDCQMPEMDGFTATREIRRRAANEQFPRIPVIALTANALKGDRERCLVAGMDDYLTKPLKAHLLRSMLGKYLGMPATQNAS